MSFKVGKTYECVKAESNFYTTGKEYECFEDELGKKVLRADDGLCDYTSLLLSSFREVKK